MGREQIRAHREASLRTRVHERLPHQDPAAVLLLLWATRLGRLMELFHQQATAGAPKLDPASQAVLAMLFVAEPSALSPTALSRIVIQTSGGMTKTLRRLEAESLVSRLPDRNDGRAVQIRLTSGGRAWIRRHLNELSARWERGLDVTPHLDVGEATATMDSLIGMLERATGVSGPTPSGPEGWLDIAVP